MIEDKGYDIREVDPAGPELDVFADVIQRSNVEEWEELAQCRSAAELKAMAMPAPGAAEIARYFVCWFDGKPVATLDVGLPLLNQTDLVTAHVRVLRAYQGYEFGRAMVDFAETIARQLGRTRVQGTTAARTQRDSRTSRFLRKAGYSEMRTLVRQDRPLTRTTIPTPKKMPSDAYRITTTWDLAHSNLVAGCALLSQQMVQDSGWKLGYTVPTTVESIRHEHDALRSGGLRILISVAQLCTSDEVVALTEIQHLPGGVMAEQYATYVTPQHRRQQLATALKTASIRALTQSGEIPVIRTFVPVEDAIMLAINRNLGYTDIAFYHEWEKVIG